MGPDICPLYDAQIVLKRAGHPGRFRFRDVSREKQIVILDELSINGRACKCHHFKWQAFENEFSPVVTLNEKMRLANDYLRTYLQESPDAADALLTPEERRIALAQLKKIKYIRVKEDGTFTVDSYVEQQIRSTNGPSSSEQVAEDSSSGSP